MHFSGMLVRSATIVAALVGATPAFAQSDLERMGRGVLDQINPLRQGERIINLGAALASGDRGRINQAIGAQLINSPSCLLCPQAAQVLAPNMSKEEVETLVGIGFLVFLDISGVGLVIPARGDTQAQSVPVSGGAPQRASTPPPASRNLSMTATCIVQRANGIRAATTDLPQLRLAGGGVIDMFSVRPGDVISVTGPRTPCPGYQAPVSSLTRAQMRFVRVEWATEPTPAGAMRYFMVGTPM
jgi:hypothetical protein